VFEDGYLPQPLTFLAAVAARTSTVDLSTGVLLAPLHHPVEIAEQAAVVDGLSGGRLELPLGAGYRVPEFELYGVSRQGRFAALEKCVHELRRIWREGRVTPQPVRGEIPLWLGVFGPRGSRLAGRLGVGLFTLAPAHWEDYLAGLEEGGHPRSAARLGGSVNIVLSDDPERDFAQLGPRIAHNANTYIRYGSEGTDQPGVGTLSQVAVREIPAEELVRSPPTRFPLGFGIYTPDEAVSHIQELVAGREVDIVYVYGAISGVVDELAWRNAELVAKELKPRLAAAPAAAAP
jgi:alkanesulfonate monooxygenase SsuD/methylene tetrahydromethanopterin reductase-like flavin-dependent oxidoreductase (luciferase family)